MFFYPVRRPPVLGENVDLGFGDHEPDLDLARLARGPSDGRYVDEGSFSERLEIHSAQGYKKSAHVANPRSLHP